MGSKNLLRRLKNYYNISFLETEIKKNKSMIYKAFLKYGYSKFTVEILEYCDSKDLIKREQYYIDSSARSARGSPGGGFIET